jgi:hypothetical protein
VNQKSGHGRLQGADEWLLGKQQPHTEEESNESRKNQRQYCCILYGGSLGHIGRDGHGG